MDTFFWNRKAQNNNTNSHINTVATKRKRATENENVIYDNELPPLKQQRTEDKAHPQPQQRENNPNQVTLQTNKIFQWQEKSDLKIYYCNVNRLNRTIDEIKFNIAKEGYDIMAFVETWLDDKNSNEELQIDGYVLHRQDSHDGVTARGVCCYVKNSIRSIKRDDLKQTKISNTMWIHIHGNHNNLGFLLGILYRSPSLRGPWIDDLSETLMNVRQKSSLPVIIAGDFNTNVDTAIQTPEAEKLLAEMKELKLEQIVKSHTRITEHSRTTIDHVYRSTELQGKVTARDIGPRVDYNQDKFRSGKK
jgi:hypothetical protein